MAVSVDRTVSNVRGARGGRKKFGYTFKCINLASLICFLWSRIKIDGGALSLKFCSDEIPPPPISYNSERCYGE